MSAGGKQSTGRMTLASHSSCISRFTALFGPVSQKRRELPCASILCVPSKPSPLKKAKSRSPVQFPKNVSAGKLGLKDQFPLLSPKLPLMYRFCPKTGQTVLRLLVRIRLKRQLSSRRSFRKSSRSLVSSQEKTAQFENYLEGGSNVY